jgi:hypothetical protein
MPSLRRAPVPFGQGHVASLPCPKRTRTRTDSVADQAQNGSTFSNALVRRNVASGSDLPAQNGQPEIHLILRECPRHPDSPPRSSGQDSSCRAVRSREHPRSHDPAPNFGKGMWGVQIRGRTARRTGRNTARRAWIQIRGRFRAPTANGSATRGSSSGEHRSRGWARGWRSVRSGDSFPGLADFVLAVCCAHSEHAPIPTAEVSAPE